MTNPSDGNDANQGRTTPRLRRSYALAAIDALREYVRSRARFALRTLAPGERLGAARNPRIVFTLPDWDTYSAMLRQRFNASREDREE